MGAIEAAGTRSHVGSMNGDAGGRAAVVRARGRLLLVTAATASIIVAIYAAVVLSHSWPDQLFYSDFVSFWTGASLVRSGAGSSLFDMGLQSSFQQQLREELATSEAARNTTGVNPFHSPPPLALLFLPLTLVPMPLAYLVWAALGLLSMLLALRLSIRGHPAAWSVAGGLLLYPAILTNLLEGQIGGVLMLDLALAMAALAGGHRALGGALFGLLWLKPQYAPLLPIAFLLKRRWVELGAMCAVGGLMAGLSVAMIGLDGVTQYLGVLRRIGAFYPPSDSLINPVAMVNWRALLMNLWPGLPGEAGDLLVLGLAGATMSVSLLVWRGQWDPASSRFPLQIMVTVIAAVVASSHSHFHGTALALGPLAFAIARSGVEVRRQGRWIVMLAIGYLLGMVAWMAREMSWLFVPYSLVLISMLIDASYRSARMEDAS
jgi:hypothetical protein